MSLFIKTTPPRLNKPTWAERHRFELLMAFGFMIILFIFIIAALCVEPTIAGVV